MLKIYDEKSELSKSEVNEMNLGENEKLERERDVCTGLHSSGDWKSRMDDANIW